VQGKVIKREFVENLYADREKKTGLLVGNWLLSLKPDEVVVSDGHNGTASVLLREAGVEIMPATA
jgi:hypothetical protein